jgi:hypothetical protein
MSTSVRDVGALLAKARETCARRDKQDRSLGLAAPGDCPLDVQVNTAISALDAALATRDWNFVAEARILLEQLPVPKSGGKGLLVL